MKIAINGIYLNFKKKNDGIGRYTHSLLLEFGKYTGIRFYVFVDRYFKYKGIKENFSKNIIPIFIPIPTFHIYLLRLWNSYLLPLHLKIFNIDLFFAPDGLSAFKGARKYVSTIHDLAFLHFPENVLPKFRKMYTNEYKRSALKSDLLITVSEYSKKDILKNYKLPESKVKVIYNGVEVSFNKEEDHNSISEVFKRFKLNSKYIFYFGTIEPRKNLMGLLKAFEMVRDSLELKLVITGKEGWLYSSFLKEVNNSKYKNDILLTGYLNDNELKALLYNATVFTYVPFFEGFGLPVVEAMAMGKWIVTSNTSSIPEIIDSETIAVDPNNIENIAKAIQLQIEKSNEKIINQFAIDKSKEFSWKKSAKQHIEQFRKIIENN